MKSTVVVSSRGYKLSIPPTPPSLNIRSLPFTYGLRFLTSLNPLFRTLNPTQKSPTRLATVCGAARERHDGLGVPEPESPAKALRRILDLPGLHQGPACFDALSARLIERAGFQYCFTSGIYINICI